ncbi:MAG: pyridoxamine 5'-phosphate oxidase [Candidatus Eisenbacteria bacterium]
MSLATLRKEYGNKPLLESRAPIDPLVLFSRWLKVALATEDVLEPTAMSLATVDGRGRPSVRLVLLKGAGAEGFQFFTNFQSRKARELDGQRHAALALWWPPLERQVRIEGKVLRLSDAESDAYFASRPRGARIGAWASPQSRVIDSRTTLEARLASVAHRYEDRDVPRPPHWGGYRVVPRVIEFWQGRYSRLHDRLRYTRRAHAWVRERLAP